MKKDGDGRVEKGNEQLLARRLSEEVGDRQEHSNAALSKIGLHEAANSNPCR